MQQVQPQVIRPIYNKKTQILHIPFEKKLLKITKAGTEQTVEFMSSLPRERMQIRVTDVGNWRENDLVTITGKNVIYTCKVANVKKNCKVIIKKISEQELEAPTNPITPEETEVIKEL